MLFEVVKMVQKQPIPTKGKVQGTSFLLDLALGGELHDEARNEIIRNTRKQELNL